MNRVCQAALRAVASMGRLAGKSGRWRMDLFMYRPARDSALAVCLFPSTVRRVDSQSATTDEFMPFACAGHQHGVLHHYQQVFPAGVESLTPDEA